MGTLNKMHLARVKLDAFVVNFAFPLKAITEENKKSQILLIPLG